MIGRRRASPEPGYVPRHMAAPGSPARPHRRRALAVAGAGTAVAAAVVAAAVVLPARSESGESAAPSGAAAEGAASPAAGVEALSAQPCVAAPLERRAALTLIVGLPGVTDADHPLVDVLAEVQPGGVMLRDENLLDDDQAAELVAGLRDRLGDDLLVAVDEEGGRVTSLRSLGDRTPSARRLGAAGPDAAEEAGEELGALLAELDIDWIFAPVVDLDGGPWDGVIGDRSYGADPVVVAETAGAFASGLRSHGIAVTLKHFPGHGGLGDPHQEMTVDTTSRGSLMRDDVVPFDDLIAAGAEAVMVGHVAYPKIWGDLPASLEASAYELLRERGFEGVAITDALGMGAVHSRWGFDVAPALALAAGADMALVNQGDRVEELLDGVLVALLTGGLSEARLDEAVDRVLALRGAATTGITCPRGR